MAISLGIYPFSDKPKSVFRFWTSNPDLFRSNFRPELADVRCVFLSELCIFLVPNDSDPYPKKNVTRMEYHKTKMGVSENSVPLNPMVLLILIPIKWLFHWEYTQHFQTNPNMIKPPSLRCFNPTKARPFGLPL